MPSPAAAGAKPERRSPWFLAVLFTANFMVVLDVFIVNVATPSLQSQLHTGSSALQWVIAAYLLVYAVGMITGGRIGDVWGRRRVFRLGMLVFALASAACAAAQSSTALIAARAVQGLGAALLLPQVLSIIQVTYEPDERPKRLAIMSGVQGVASATGQLLGGALITLNLLGLGWRWVFLVNVPIGIVAVILAGRVIPESRSDEAHSLDLAGVALGSLVLSLIAVPIVEGRSLHWPPWLIAALVAAVPAAFAFVALERRVKASGRAPLVELALFAQRGYRLAVAGTLLLFLTPSFFFVLALYLQDGAGLSPIESGLVFSPMAIGFAAASLVGPRVLHESGPPVAVLGALGILVGLAATIAVLLVTGGTLSVAVLILATIPVGTGMGLAVPIMFAAALRTVPVDSAGTASGMVNTSVQLGNALGIAAIGAVFFGKLGSATSLGAYSDAFVLAAVAELVAVGLAAVVIARLARATRGGD